MDKASELIYALKPVSFRYNKEYDATQTLGFGLIAEDVAKVYPDLVGRNPRANPNRSGANRSMRCYSTSFSRNIRKWRNNKQLLRS
jgi:Chaperone of endosialidase